MAHIVKKQISLDIGSRPFSLIIDESTDTTVIKYLAIFIKYYSKTASCCRTRLLKLQTLNGCDASNIVCGYPSE